MRFFAYFKSGAMEMEIEDDNLSEARAWIANLLDTHHSPDCAYIHDRLEDVEIFREELKEEPINDEV